MDVAAFLLVLLNGNLFGNELYIRFTVHVFCGRLSNCVPVFLSLLILRVGFGM